MNEKKIQIAAERIMAGMNANIPKLSLYPGYL